MPKRLVSDASIFEIQALEVNTLNSQGEWVLVVKRYLINGQPTYHTRWRNLFSWPSDWIGRGY